MPNLPYEDPRLEGVDRYVPANQSLLIAISKENLNLALESAATGDAGTAAVHLRRADNAVRGRTPLSEAKWRCLVNAHRARQDNAPAMFRVWIDLAHRCGEVPRIISRDLCRPRHALGQDARVNTSKTGDAVSSTRENGKLVALAFELSSAIFTQVSPGDYRAAAGACRSLRYLLASDDMIAAYGGARYPGLWFSWFKLLALANPPSTYSAFVRNFEAVQRGESETLEVPTGLSDDPYNHIVGAAHRFLYQVPARLETCKNVRRLRFVNDWGGVDNLLCAHDDVWLAEIVRQCSELRYVHPTRTFTGGCVGAALVGCQKLAEKSWSSSEDYTIDDVVQSHRNWPAMESIHLQLNGGTTPKHIRDLIKASPKLKALTLAFLSGSEFDDECLRALPTTCASVVLDNWPRSGGTIAMSDECIVETLRRLPDLSINVVRFARSALNTQDEQIAARFIID